MNETLTLIISIAAIVISIASFVFTLYQHHKHQNIVQSSKAIEVLKHGFSLRNASQQLRDKISVTDDIDDCDELLNTIDSFTESMLPKILKKQNISIQDIYKLEIEDTHKFKLPPARPNRNIWYLLRKRIWCKKGKSRRHERKTNARSEYSGYSDNRHAQ